jgi:large repetitive protein
MLHRRGRVDAIRSVLPPNSAALYLVAGNYDQANRAYVNDGSGAFTDSAQSLGANNTYSVALGDIDIDGDGDLDLVGGNEGQANRVWRND